MLPTDDIGSAQDPVKRLRALANALAFGRPLTEREEEEVANHLRHRADDLEAGHGRRVRRASEAVKEEYAAVLRLWQANTPAHRIATKLGVSRSVLLQVMHDDGLL